MTIGIDCRFATTSSGLGSYTRELVTHLLKRKDDVKYVLFVNPGDHQWLPSLITNNYSLITNNSRHYSLSEQIQIPFLIKRSGIDLLFSPHFNVPLFCPVPFVATIHDLILHRYPNQTSAIKQRAYRLLMKHTVKKAKALIAVSTFTADEIVKTYGKELRKKITVIHEAAGNEFARKSAAACGPVLKKYDLPKPFFLYVGNAKEHKNVQMLIDAYKSLDSTETELVLVTGGRESNDLRLCDGVRIVRDVPAPDLSCLYYFAVAFVTASLYEGFGLPVLEAQASGCPVIVTNTGSLPEIAPEGSRIVEPTVEDIADALRDPPSPPDMDKMRTWGEVASETITVLRK
ncbi:MAG: glycosyltransferase family 4 protein [Candidatus Peribacteraceae bacterium]|nr:glycosyltransferase family 4 protein [Candidatus Peribacteraceae bacterium]